jgi:hypothetical protein
MKNKRSCTQGYVLSAAAKVIRTKKTFLHIRGCWMRHACGAADAVLTGIPHVVRKTLEPVSIRFQ